MGNNLWTKLCVKIERGSLLTLRNLSEHSLSLNFQVDSHDEPYYDL